MSSMLENIGWWQDWMLAPLIALAFGFYWVVDWFGSRSDRPIAAAWADTAETLNASFRSKHQGLSDMRIEGTSPAGVDFEIQRVMTDRFGGVATRYVVEFEDAAVPEFSLVGKGVGTLPPRKPRVAIGDERLDDLLRLRSSDERVHVYLTLEVLNASASLIERFDEVRISNSKIVAQSEDLEKDPQAILRTVETLMDLVRLLSPTLALAPQK